MVRPVAVTLMTLALAAGAVHRRRAAAEAARRPSVGAARRSVPVAVALPPRAAECAREGGVRETRRR